MRLYKFGLFILISACGNNKPTSETKSNNENSFSNHSLEREIAKYPAESFEAISLKSISNNCNGVKNLKRLEIPKDHFSASEKFSYYYEHNIKNNGTTWIAIPGGPGGSLIGYSNQHLFKNTNVIAIDPRGTGCNYGTQQDFPSKTMSTQQAIHDIIAIIKQENLRDYVIMGSSYGTVVATMLENELQRSGVKMPKAIVLEGTLGKEIGTWKNYYTHAVDVGNKFINSINGLSTALKSEPLPLNSSKYFWLKELDPFNYEFANKKKIIDRIFSIQNGEIADNGFSSTLNQPDHSTAEIEAISAYERTNYVMLYITCSELTRTFSYSLHSIDLQNGQLVVKDRDEGLDACKNFPHIQFNAYDSAKYQIKTAIVYFQGEYDAQTPLETAKYHFDHQKLAKNKTWIQVQSGEHATLQNNLSQCASKLVEKINAEEFDFSEIIDSNGICK